MKKSFAQESMLHAITLNQGFDSGVGRKQAMAMVTKLYLREEILGDINY